MTATARAPNRSSPAPAIRAEKDAWWLLVDPLLVLSAAAITVMGAVLVYSATRGTAELANPDTSFLRRQAGFAVAGMLVGTAAAFVEPRHLKRLWPFAFAAMIAALAAVAAFGLEVHGTRGWFDFGGLRLQPSEPAKLVLIVGLALLLSPSRQGGVGVDRLAVALGVTAAPVALLLLQPDLGTMLVYLAVAFAMIVASGVQARWIALLTLVAVVGTVGVLRSDVLKGYQRARLTVFLFAPEDLAEYAETHAFNATQAQIAVGNGGLTGQGLFQGTQTRSQLVPAQQTDFIFTVAGEELGLRGAGALLGLYALLLLRIWRTALIASSVFGRLVCAGVFSMLAFQMFQAVGMTMGMMPITGIPLPLVSYGGSSMVTSMAALGLVAGVYRRRLRIDEMRD